MLGEGTRLDDREALATVPLGEQVVGVASDDQVDLAAQGPAQPTVVVDAGVAEQHHEVGALGPQVVGLAPYRGHPAAFAQPEVVVLRVVVGHPDHADAERARLEEHRRGGPVRRGAGGRLQVAHQGRAAQGLGVARQQLGSVAEQTAVAGDRGVHAGGAEESPSRGPVGQGGQAHARVLHVAAVEQQDGMR